MHSYETLLSDCLKMGDGIIAVEGLWRVGKTTLAQSLAYQLKGKYIAEPNHLLSNVQGNIEDWYWKQFNLIEEQAQKIKDDGGYAVLDRSKLSVLSFLYALKTQPQSLALKEASLLSQPRIIDKMIFLAKPDLNAWVNELNSERFPELNHLKPLFNQVDFVDELNRYLMNSSKKLVEEKNYYLMSSTW